MWIVNLAIKRPYTFIVLAIFILIIGVLSIVSTPKDIFPSINIPVISVIFPFPGMAPRDLEEHLTSVYERVLTTTVDNIEHIESESLFGIAVVKIFLQPSASVPRAIAQVTSVSQFILKLLPSGTTPPLVLSYSATNVPVLRVGLGGLSEQQLNDLGFNFVRTQLITVPGVAIPYPYGGSQRYVEVDLNYKALQGYGLTPFDVVNTITAQNLILPSGTEKIGRFEYLVGLNSSPDSIEKLNAIPIKSLANGTTVYIRDVANILNGSIPQTNIVRFNGRRAAMLDIQKIGSASTLDIVQGVKNKIPDLKQTLPGALRISMLSDQSVFVSGAIEGVVREAVIAGCLTAIMILLFLGDWKSTLIVAISIPLAILSSIAVLSAIGQTLNIMTLGGLALAVGILVDDATVTIENIDRHLAEGKPPLDAIRDGTAQIAVAALVSTLCICIVFVPIFFLSGVAKYLFSPLAEAVIFAMITSYILSRTLVPTLAMYWIKKHSKTSDEDEGRKTVQLFAWFSRFHYWFEHQFEKLRESYRDLLSFGLGNAGKLVTIVLGFTAGTMALFPFLGQDFFPSVDAGAFDMHVRMKAGTRIEETARSADEIEQMIRQVIPANQLAGIIDNLGIPYSGINTSYNNTGTMSAADGDILVSLNKHHDPTNKFIQEIRARVQHDFVGVDVWFPPADIVAQILNFGLPAPIDVQVVGVDQEANFQFASNLMNQIRKIPGAVDFRIQEPDDAPELDITMDRTKALMVVNFQSWTGPFIIITALPCALAGIVWILFVTGTTLSVPALMGAIMCMGVATANSVLVVTFANERLNDYNDSYRAALEAGYARIRPVLMTAIAMIIGMLPMALGLGEGGEQNAPLGRAVIGGLIFATGATLFFVPSVFMIMRRGRKFRTPERIFPGTS